VGSRAAAIRKQESIASKPANQAAKSWIGLVMLLGFIG
jgi:hypothetical protein